MDSKKTFMDIEQTSIALEITNSVDPTMLCLE